MQRARTIIIDLKVRSPGNRIQLMQVIGQHANIEQALAQICQHLRLIVHTGKKNRLIQHDDPFPTQRCQGFAKPRRNLTRMVDVHDQADGQPRATEHLDQITGHSSGQDNGQTRVNPQSQQVRQPLQAIEQRAQIFIRKAEGIPSAENDFGDVRPPGQHLKRCLPAISDRRIGAVRIVSAKAVAAMHGAGTRSDEQRPSCIFLQQAAPDTDAKIPHRIGDIPRHIYQLFGHRQYLAEQRISRISMTHEVGKVSGYAQRKRRSRLVSLVSHVIGQAQVNEQFSRVSEAPGQLPLPGFRNQNERLSVHPEQPCRADAAGLETESEHLAMGGNFISRASYRILLQQTFTRSTGLYVDDMIKNDGHTMRLRLDSLWSIGVDDAPTTTPRLPGLGTLSGKYTKRDTLMVEIALSLGSP